MLCLIPNHHEGYSTDDNARALIVSILASSSQDEAAKQGNWLRDTWLFCGLPLTPPMEGFVTF